jgi:NosR/NirI family nitrous oxide reductase transcriptional regulator
MNPISKYVRWLHTQWPAGKVEKLPVVQPDGATNVPGLYIVGDLTGVPLLKFSADTGARAVQTLAGAGHFKKDHNDEVDIAIVGGGVSGFAAALEARKHGLRYVLFEASEPYSTIVNFPKAKPIFTYPTDMTPAGELQFHEKSAIKEGLLEDLHEQTLVAGIEPRHERVSHVERRGDGFDVKLVGGDSVRAHRVIVGIGRSGNFRKMGVPGEDLDKVYNRLHDPKDFCGQNALVVGGGDSALEAAIALAQCGANVTISYRKPEFSRPKPENIEKIEALLADPEADVQVEEPVSERVTTAAGGFLDKDRKGGNLRLMMASQVKEIRDNAAVVRNADGQDETLQNDVVFAMIGREPPLDFFRRSGVRITGEWTTAALIGPLLFLLLCVWVYPWKAGMLSSIPLLSPDPSWIGQSVENPQTLLGTLAISAASKSFYYTLAYSTLIVVFGILRIRRRKTPYVKWQTLSLMAIQVIPLFILPEIVFPLLGHNGWFESGTLGWLADQFFPLNDQIAHGREYWRAYGFILAWPLLIGNWFTAQPLWGWLILGSLQTFVLIPLIIYYWGKGAYCGWICSCGAMAETLGDQHRHKMPHGPLWNRVNMLGQVILAVAVLTMIVRIIGWITGSPAIEGVFSWIYGQYSLYVDLVLAGSIGYGLYFMYSGRVWCRFMCPLAALMHIYSRFSRFRILADKKKCISCNVCTSVCHQGIDIMNFANKGLPMKDPECVRCSACVQMCPTGVLSFGQVNRAGDVIGEDPQWLAASRVRLAEGQPQP